MPTAELTGSVCMQPGPRKALAAPGTRQHCGALVKGKGCPLKSTGQQSIFAQVAGEEAKTRHLGDLSESKDALSHTACHAAGATVMFTSVDFALRHLLMVLSSSRSWSSRIFQSRYPGTRKTDANPPTNLRGFPTATCAPCLSSMGP